MLEALDEPEFARLERREAPEAALDDIARVHPRRLCRAVLAAVPAAGHVGIDADTIVSPGSGEAALRAAGAVVAAVDAVVGGEADNAFCAVRPPGHHAEPGAGDGVLPLQQRRDRRAAARARCTASPASPSSISTSITATARRPLRRRASLFYASTHQWPFYPGTGAASETGVGNIFNAPLRPMSGSRQFRHAVTQRDPAGARCLPPRAGAGLGRVRRPPRDPLAQLELDEADYAWITEQLLEIAERHAGGRLVSTLEGGYDLAALGASAAAHIRVLMSA